MADVAPSHPVASRPIASFEAACAEAEAAAGALVAATKKLERLAGAIKKAAAVGETAKLRSSTEALAAGLAEVARAVEATRQAWPHGDGAVAGYLEGPYTDELIATARDAGVSLTRLDDRLAAFPVVVQVQAGRRAVRVDGKPVKGIRPSAVVAAVRAHLARPSSRPEAFIEELYRAYRFAAHGDQARRGVRALDLYEVLTIRAEHRRSYSRADFARDLFVLDTSGRRETRGGARLELAGSTSVKGQSRTLVVHPPDGPPRYYGDVRFTEPDR